VKNVLLIVSSVNKEDRRVDNNGHILFTIPFTLLACNIIYKIVYFTNTVELVYNAIKGAECSVSL
jgi:hypothetical protein